MTELWKRLRPVPPVEPTKSPWVRRAEAKTLPPKSTR